MILKFVDQFLDTFAGTNKLKELHPSMVPVALQGYWRSGTAGTFLHGYVLNFEVKQSEEHRYTSFVLLVGAEFDDDVAHLKTRLVLPRDRDAIAELPPLGKITLSSNQVLPSFSFVFVIQSLYLSSFTLTFGSLAADVQLDISRFTVGFNCCR